MFTDKQRKYIKIIDFGVSGLFKGEKSKAGSIKYMAPEVLSGDNTESRTYIDIWSLGCILYHLIVGEELFKGNREEIKVINLEYIVVNSILYEYIAVNSIYSISQFMFNSN